MNLSSIPKEFSTEWTLISASVVPHCGVGQDTKGRRGRGPRGGGWRGGELNDGKRPMEIELLETFQN